MAPQKFTKQGNHYCPNTDKTSEVYQDQIKSSEIYLDQIKSNQINQRLEHAPPARGPVDVGSRDRFRKPRSRRLGGAPRWVPFGCARHPSLGGCRKQRDTQQPETSDPQRGPARACSCGSSGRVPRCELVSTVRLLEARASLEVLEGYFGAAVDSLLAWFQSCCCSSRHWKVLERTRSLIQWSAELRRVSLSGPLSCRSSGSFPPKQYHKYPRLAWDRRGLRLQTKGRPPAPNSGLEFPSKNYSPFFHLVLLPLPVTSFSPSARRLATPAHTPYFLSVSERSRRFRAVGNIHRHCLGNSLRCLLPPPAAVSLPTSSTGRAWFFCVAIQ